jgi:hypothetical protein
VDIGRRCYPPPGRNRPQGAKLGFESIEVPTDPRGIGDTVTAIDHDRDGRAGFVIVNGREKAFGAVQLISLAGEGMPRQAP